MPDSKEVRVLFFKLVSSSSPIKNSFMSNHLLLIFCYLMRFFFFFLSVQSIVCILKWQSLSQTRLWLYVSLMLGCQDIPRHQDPKAPVGKDAGADP